MRCLNDYFLHQECGYTFDKHGVIAALTPNEVQRLWKGMSLWQEEVENADEADAGSHSAKARQEATAADKRHFNELAEESGNMKRN